MTQLTRKEIVELRARAIYNRQWPNHPREEIPEVYTKAAEATIEADEKAGVLMLVEEGEVKEGDYVDRYGLSGFIRKNQQSILGFISTTGDGYPYFTEYDEDCVIRNRNTSLVYQCAKEQSDGK